MTAEQIVTDKMIDSVLGNVGFANETKRDVIKNSLLKCVCGIEVDKRARRLLYELDLISISKTLTHTGKQYLYSEFAIQETVGS